MVKMDPRDFGYKRVKRINRIKQANALRLHFILSPPPQNLSTASGAVRICLNRQRTPQLALGFQRPARNAASARFAAMETIREICRVPFHNLKPLSNRSQAANHASNATHPVFTGTLFDIAGKGMNIWSLAQGISPLKPSRWPSTAHPLPRNSQIASLQRTWRLLRARCSFTMDPLHILPSCNISTEIWSPIRQPRNQAGQWKKQGRDWICSASAASSSGLQTHRRVRGHRFWGRCQ